VLGRTSILYAGPEVVINPAVELLGGLAAHLLARFRRDVVGVLGHLNAHSLCIL
jgi:hypothetical protein